MSKKQREGVYYLVHAEFAVDNLVVIDQPYHAPM